jgi:hypothetical protein
MVSIKLIKLARTVSSASCSLALAIGCLARSGAAFSDAIASLTTSAAIEQGVGFHEFVGSSREKRGLIFLVLLDKIGLS